jgi:TolB protein
VRFVDARLASLVVLASLTACKSKARKSPAPAPVVVTSDAVASDISTEAPPAAAPAAATKLPGALYFKRGEALVKLEAGMFTTDFANVGAPLFPSQFALPDGRVVGIASKGDGEAGSEQLVLIGPGTKVERIGPAHTQVRNPAVDPSGAWIVIESKVEPHSELYRIDLASPKPVQLTDNPQGNFSPAILDVKTVVFASSRDGDSEIYKLDLATKKPTRLTAFHRDDWSPRVSPDRKTIAFLSDREGPPRIFLVNADGTQLRRFTASSDTSEEDDPTWSPDGASIAFLRAGKLVVREVVAGAAGSAAAERVLTPDGARDAEPAWSPDGQYIAVSRTRPATSTTPASVADIWVIPLASTDAIAVTSDADARLPRWHTR